MKNDLFEDKRVPKAMSIDFWTHFGPRSDPKTNQNRVQKAIEKCIDFLIDFGSLLGPSWGLLGASWGPLGGLSGASWAPLGGLWGPLGDPLRREPPRKAPKGPKRPPKGIKTEFRKAALSLSERFLKAPQDRGGLGEAPLNPPRAKPREAC